MSFRHATCNEAFEKWDFAEACRAIRRIGYTGIEIAPFTLAEDPATVTPQRRREVKDIIQSEGLDYVGLHWIMVSPKGLHVTTPDLPLRERSWQHIRNLIDLSADLSLDENNGGVLVFGSPKQRSSTGGLSPAEATKNYVDGLTQLAGQLAERRVTLLIEALPMAQSDVVTTLDEAASHVKSIGSPYIQTMFDTHNAIDEVEAHEVLVERHFDLIRHVHVNELDGRHCGAPNGTEDYNFRPLFRKLKQLNYQGWVSLEAFDFTPGAEVLARESFDYLQRIISEEGL
jgi:D-psicose/D-tagatose/L-ribulose 3-epimerase